MTRLPLARPAALPGALLALCGLVASVGCTAPPPHARASAAAQAACRTHADDVYLRQNRDAIYRADNYTTQQRDTPFAASGMPGLTTTGLSEEYGRDTTMENCLNGMGNSNTPSAAGYSVNPGGEAPSTMK